MTNDQYSRIIGLCLMLTVAMFSTETVNAAQNAVANTETTIINIEKRDNIRVVYDVSRNDLEAGIGRALYYVRGLLEAYKDMEVEQKALHISVVVHGAAAYWMLKPETYQKYIGDAFAFNPNDKIIEELIDHGVSVEICYVTMKGHGWMPEDILPGVKLVHDGYTRMIDLQQRGYAYISF